MHPVAAARRQEVPMETEQGQAQRDLVQVVASDRRRPRPVAAEVVPRRLEVPLPAHLAVMAATATRGSTDRHTEVEVVVAPQTPEIHAALEARVEAGREAIRIQQVRWRKVERRTRAVVVGATDQVVRHPAQVAPAS